MKGPLFRRTLTGPFGASEAWVLVSSFVNFSVCLLSARYMLLTIGSIKASKWRKKALNLEYGACRVRAVCTGLQKHDFQWVPVRYTFKRNCHNSLDTVLQFLPFPVLKWVLYFSNSKTHVYNNIFDFLAVDLVSKIFVSRETLNLYHSPLRSESFCVQGIGKDHMFCPFIVPCHPADVPWGVL